MFDRKSEAALTRNYEQASDDRLADLAKRPNELTNLARELLFGELRRRRTRLAVNALPTEAITSAHEGAATQPPGERQLWYARPGDYAELAPPDCVFPIGAGDEIHAMRVSLALAGIPQDEFWPHNRADLRPPFLAVRPEDSKRARAILALPVPQQVKDQIQAELEQPEDEVPPSCPACGAPDALLTSVDPVNTWYCEECGANWLDQTQAQEQQRLTEGS